MNSYPTAPSQPDPRVLADRALAWLRGHQVRTPGYDQGGILDSLDGRVLGDHYATMHFAWACALRHAAKPDQQLLDAALEAVAFHLRTSKDEYAPGSWSYHWDFNNLASMETYLLLRPEAGSALDRQWLTSLRTWKTNPHWSVNWLAMRALAHYKRHELFGNARDLETADKWLGHVLEAQKADGGIEDVKGRSLPSQYHAYTACLLHRMMPAHPCVPWAVKNAARWLLAVTAPDGEMNALGRGQGQIFGYACAVYLFRAAASLDAELAPNHLWAARVVLDRLARHQTEDGWWPLVLNGLPVERRAGWYDYHHLSVYNAFASTWLTLASALQLPILKAEAPGPGLTWLKDSGLLAVRRKHWFALFAAGREGAQYATEAGITPHLILWQDQDLYRYPLGPGPGKYGSLAQGKGQEANCWSPLWRNQDQSWQAPTGADGTLEQGQAPNRWRLSLERDEARWERELILGRRFLETRDMLMPPNAPEGSPPPVVRAHNFSWREDASLDVGKAFVRDLDSGAVLRTWGGDSLAWEDHLDTAWGRTRILGGSGHGPTVLSGWRLRQGPAQSKGRLPGIVCLSWDPWSSLWKRKQRLLFELARLGRSTRTLYLEPPTSITHIAEQTPSLFTSGGKSLRRSLRSVPEHLGHGFHLASPLWPWPGGRTFPALDRANQRAWLGQLRRFTKKVGFPDGYVLWLYHPSQLTALDALADNAELVVFDWTDDWPQALPPHVPTEDRQLLEKRQQELLCRADVVFAVSRELVRRAEAFCPHVLHLPNATDPETFKPCDPGRPRHPLAARRPTLVYLSQITERLDVELLRQMAQARPDWILVLAGPLACPPQLVSQLESLDNVVLAGPLPYQEAAELTAQADVCILPHREDALTAALDPIKLYDYLATGRPVVSTAVGMNPELAGLVRVASGAARFIQAVESALAEPASMAHDRRRAAMAHTWTARAEQAADLLERFFPEE